MCLLAAAPRGSGPGITWSLACADLPAVGLGRNTTLALPTLTPEQRAEALAKAAEARKARSELLASIKSGKESIEKVLKQAKEHKTIGKTKVTQLLKAVPGLGAVKVAALLEQAGIDPDRRAAGLGERQREALIDALK